MAGVTIADTSWFSDRNNNPGEHGNLQFTKQRLTIPSSGTDTATTVDSIGRIMSFNEGSRLHCPGHAARCRQGCPCRADHDGAGSPRHARAGRCTGA